MSVLMSNVDAPSLTLERSTVNTMSSGETDESWLLGPRARIFSFTGGLLRITSPGGRFE